MRKRNQTHAAMQQPDKRDRLLRWSIRILLLVALISGISIGVYMLQSKQSQQEFEQLKAVMGGAHQTTQVQIKQPEVEQTEEERLAAAQAAEQAQTQAVLSGLAELQEQNPDIVGWIQIPGTKVDYPVMYTPDDPEFYLHRNFSKKYSASGVPFIDAKCNLEERSDNVIVYGHNMKNGSMFAGLLHYGNRSYWEQHPLIYLYTDGQRQVYEIISAFAVSLNASNFAYYEMIDAEGAETFAQYIKKAKAVSVYDTGVSAEYGDALLTLSTCSYQAKDGRFVVIARMQRAG